MITFKYTLTQDAQRHELAAGRPAHAERTIALTPTPALAARADLDRDGSATILARPITSQYASLAFAPRVFADEAGALAWLAEIDAAAREEIEARKQRDAEEREAAIVALIARPDEEWFEPTYAGNADESESGKVGRKDGCPALSPCAYKDDQRVADRIAYIEAGPLTDARMAWSARRAARIAEDELAARKQTAVEFDCRMWIAEHGLAKGFAPEVVRAAREGRQIRKAISEDVCRRLLRALEPIGGAWIVDSYDEEPRDDVPTPEAYRLFDALTEARDAIASELGLPNVRVEVGPIARHDIAERVRKWRTGVEVVVSHPWLVEPISRAVLAEPPGDEDEG